MKSYINTLADYKQAPIERVIDLTCPEDYIDKKIKAAAKAYKKNVPAEIIQKGDVAVIAMESTLPRYNKKSAFVTIGGGMLNAEFEAQLIGHKVGEVFTATAENTEVSVTIKSITRTVYPKLTDDMVKEFASHIDGMEDVFTVQQYIDYIVNEYKEETRQTEFYGKVNEIIEYVLTNSDWEFDDSEITELVSEQKAAIESELANEGKSLETLTQTELQGYYGVESVEEMDAMLKAYSEQSIASALFVAFHTGLDAKAVELGDEALYNYEFLEKYAESIIEYKED